MKRLTKGQACVIMVMTGVQCMKGEDFRTLVEKKLGRVVSKQEFTTKEFIEELQNIYSKDWDEMLNLTEDSGLLVFK